MITRGLLTENSDGTFSCAVCIPASMIAAVLAGDAVKIGAQTPSPIAIKWADEGEDKAEAHPASLPKPETQGIATGGIESPELKFGQVSEAHAALLGRIEEVSHDPIFQNYARKKLGADGFSGGIRCALDFLFSVLSRSTEPESALNEIMRTFRECYVS